MATELLFIEIFLSKVKKVDEEMKHDLVDYLLYYEN